MARKTRWVVAHQPQIDAQWYIDTDQVYDEYQAAKQGAQITMNSGSYLAAAWRQENAQDCLKLVNEILPMQPRSAYSVRGDQVRREERERFGPRPVLYTKNEHVSRSNMSAVISVHMIATRNGELDIMNITSFVCRAKNASFHPKYGGITVGGCGLDRGFHLISGLSRVLYDNDYMLGHRWL